MQGLELAGSKRLVIKIGSSLLIGHDGRLNAHWLQQLAADIASLRSDGHEVLVVSSGAVAIGGKILGISRRKARLEELQAAAAAGQVRLVHAYQDALSEFSVPAAQVLLTPDDTEVRARFQNVRNTLEKLLEFGVVPIINENDTVATDELRYGDNDRLAARVAQVVMADVLVLLSDVDGFYTDNPQTSTSAEHIPLVRCLDDETMAMAGGSVSGTGSGGMRTKLLAARIATHAGCSTIIASGQAPHALRQLLEGGRCTVFLSEGTPAAARKQWLAGALEVRGRLEIDGGALAALRNGKSLLPVGVTSVDGAFVRGDAISLVDAGGQEIGRGLAGYDSEEARLIIGCKSDGIESKLGYAGRAAIVHRDDLVLFSNRNIQKTA